jgi:hypothetical protein
MTILQDVLEAHEGQSIGSRTAIFGRSMVGGGFVGGGGCWWAGLLFVWWAGGFGLFE